jgi:hypothetical protein
MVARQQRHREVPPILFGLARVDQAVERMGAAAGKEIKCGGIQRADLFVAFYFGSLEDAVGKLLGENE